MDKVAEINQSAHEYLNRINPHCWTRTHFDESTKCDMLLNNLFECFNSYILDARFKGIVTMNEMIRSKLMKRIHMKRDAMEKCKSVYYPKILKQLEKSKRGSFMYYTEWNEGDKYQVVGPEVSL